MKYQAENIISGFFHYMWNTWSEDECKTVFKDTYPHFWDKWKDSACNSTCGAAERFYARLSDENRQMLIERAIKLYDGKEYRHKKEDSEIFVCNDCGSPEVELKAWVNANTDEYISDADDDDSGRWCNQCESNTDLCNKAEYIEKMNKWWKSNDCHTVEIISGLKRTEHQLEHKFIDTANNWWKSLSYDTQRKIYIKYN